MSTLKATSEEAIGRGYARDGGLYLPEDLDILFRNSKPSNLNSAPYNSSPRPS